jgi:PAS domain-containing protein
MLREISEGVSVQDSPGRLVYANDAAARIFGFPNAESLVATSMADVRARVDLITETGAAIDTDFPRTARWPGRTPSRDALDLQ